MPDNVQHIFGSIEAVRKGDPGPPGLPGQDGVSPEVSIGVITGGHSVTITDADHPDGQTFDVMDGQDGAPGQDGQDGVSPEVTIGTITGGHSVTITDADHPGGQTFNVMDGQDGAPGQDGADGAPGQDGQDGVSPEVTISTITGGHRVTITDADHPGGQTFDVMDGEEGPQGPAGPTEVFWATYGTTTSAEIEAAYQAGKLIACSYNDKVYIMYARASSAAHIFISFVYGNMRYVLRCLSNSWDTQTVGFIYMPSGSSNGDVLTYSNGDWLPSAPQQSFRGTCSTAAATTAKTSSITGYKLTTGNIVSIRFSNDVPAGATLNISSTGAKAIYYKNSAIPAGIIKAGDTATFIYSTYYHLISIDRQPSKSDVGLGNVDNIQQYSANNPPPYPVTSVNNQTGAVSLSIPSTASDVGAVAVAQGVAHAGEFVVVGSDGNITTVTMAVWQGGSY